jgi:hypothetical protein
MVRLKPVMERLEPDTDPYIHEVIESLEPDTGVYPLGHRRRPFIHESLRGWNQIQVITSMRS